MGDESKLTAAPVGKSNDVELVPPGGLRNRKQVQTRDGSTVLHPHEEEMLHQTGPEGLDISSHQQLVVEHHQPTGSSTQDSGWFARIAALLVGDDPTQSYALICGNCHVHNGKGKEFYTLNTGIFLCNKRLIIFSISQVLLEKRISLM